jgi:AraC-like DNA-binding protein
VYDHQNRQAIHQLQAPPSSNFFSIQNTNLARSLIRFPIPPHRVDFYEILVVRSGHNRRQIDLVTFELKDYSFSVTLPGQIVSDNLESDRMDGYHLYFDELFLTHTDTTLLQLPMLDSSNICFANVDPAMLGPAFQILERMESLYVHHAADERLRWYLGILLHELNYLYVSQAVPAAQSSHHNAAHRFRQLLNKQPDASRAIDTYARQLHITSRQLHSLVVQAFGMAPQQLKAASLSTNASFLLANTTAPVGEIALQLGFEDTAYFSRFFKKHTGHTPSEWRALQHNNTGDAAGSAAAG